MDDKLFNKLIISTKEAKNILSKTTTPSRNFYIFDVKQYKLLKLLSIKVKIK